MKSKPKLYFFITVLLFLAIINCASVNVQNETPLVEPERMIIDNDVSYAIGMYLAWQFMLPDVTYDYSAFVDGFKAYTENQSTRFSMDDGVKKIEAFFDQLAERDRKNDEISNDYDYDNGSALEKGIAFLEENAKRPGVITTGSGLQYEVIMEGSGRRPGPSSYVLVHYEGKLIDGFIFDSSYYYDEPIDFPLDVVIPGFAEGLELMREGSIYMLYIPHNLGYGPYSAGLIPAYSTLIFKVELITVN